MGRTYTKKHLFFNRNSNLTRQLAFLSGNPDLGIDLTKHIQDSDAKNYTTLMEETRRPTGTKDTVRSQMGRLNTVKSLVLPKLTYRLHAIPVNIPAGSVVDTDEFILKWNRNGKEQF